MGNVNVKPTLQQLRDKAAAHIWEMRRSIWTDDCGKLFAGKCMYDNAFIRIRVKHHVPEYPFGRKSTKDKEDERRGRRVLYWVIDPNPYNSDYDECAIRIGYDEEPDETKRAVLVEAGHKTALECAVAALEKLHDESAVIDEGPEIEADPVDFTVRMYQHLLDPEDVEAELT